LEVKRVVLGLAIGAASGVIQFYLLMKFTGSITGGKPGGKTVLFALTQFLFPFAVLLLCAFFLSESLMMIGIGMAAALIACAVIKYIFFTKTKPGTKKSGKK